MIATKKFSVTYASIKWFEANEVYFVKLFILIFYELSWDIFYEQKI